MRKCKNLIGVVLIFVICFSFCSCDSSDKDVSNKNTFAGVWTDSHEKGKDHYYYELVLNTDGTYSEQTYKNDRPLTPREGEYETGDNTVTLHLSPTVTSTYVYENGKLCNGDIAYTKK